MIQKSFRLLPFVLIVSGIEGAALYDLHKGRLLPLNNLMKRAINQATSTNSLDKLKESVPTGTTYEECIELFDKLIELKFGRYYDQEGLKTYMQSTFVQEESTLAPLNSLSISSDFILQCDVSLFSEFSAQLKLVQSSFLLNGVYLTCSGNESGSFSRNRIVYIQNILESFVNVQIVHERDADKKTIAFWKKVLHSQKIGFSCSDFKGMSRFGKNDLAVTVNAYKHMTHYSLFGNAIHITGNGDVIPCIHEPDLLLGNIYRTSLMEITQSKRCYDVWHHTRDKIDKCKDCEFRYACLNPYSFRAKTSDLSSEPLNCNYDPYSGRWLEDTA